MKRPTKITPDPIIDAVVEFRFESDVPSDAIFGMLFANIKSKYPDFKKLPIVTIPEEIRKNDPTFQFKPYYQAQSGPFKLNIGPRVLSLSNSGKYVGWKKNYFPELQELMNKVEQSGIVSHFTRLGIRYIDFFDFDVFGKINLSIELNESPLQAEQTTLSTLFKTGAFLTKSVVANNITATIDGKEKSGSIIDTDTFFEPQEKFGFEGLRDLMNSCHEESSIFFFSLLKTEFLETLNPEYEK